MADNYKEFDKASIIGSEDIRIKGYSFRKREIALAAAVLVALLVCVILAALLASAKSESHSPAPTTGAQIGGGTLHPGSCVDSCMSPVCLKSASFVASNLNVSVDPCNDFHEFACGSYAKNNPLHPDYASMTVASQIYEKSQQKLRVLLETSTQRSTPDSAERKMKDFFASCLDDFGKMLVKGNPFLEKVLPQAGGWNVLNTWDESTFDYKQMIKTIHVDLWTNVFFTYSVKTDWYDWNKQAIQIDLAGMGMPWVYYVRSGAENLQSDYRKFIRAVGRLLVRDANANLTKIESDEKIETFVNDAYAIEEQLANFTATSKATLNPHDEEERMSLEELDASTNSQFDFVGLFSYMFDQAGVDKNTKVVVLEKDYINKLANYLGTVLTENKKRKLNNYYTWRLAQRYIQELSWEYVHANREFYYDATGNAEFLGTWRYCLSLISRDMGEVLSSLYVRDHFVDKNKAKAMEIVDYIKTSMIERVMANTWMEESTKEKAKQKLENTLYKLGYPDYIMDNDKLDTIYSSLKIVRGDYFTNFMNFNVFFKEDWNRRLRHNTDKSQWNYKTYDVTAEYYNPWSELIVPAGMLQFPIYDHALPHYINFGSIGVVISHHLVHAFDQYGQQYKLDGTWWGAWWTNATTKRYLDIRKCVVDLYKNVAQGPFTLPQGEIRVPIDSLGYSPEALAETTALRVSYKAYKEWTAKMRKGKPEEKIVGVMRNNDQMFFISYAQSNCYNRRQVNAWSEAAKGTILEDTRINLAVSQLEEFQNAFNCPANSKMVSSKKCPMY